MVSRLEQLLSQANLNIVFEKRKDAMVEAVWTYIQGFQILNDTEPPPHTVRIFIWESIRFLPEVLDFYCLFDSSKEVKDEIKEYLIDKFYTYSLEKLQKLHRIKIE
jgi:hypothetical protein